MKQPHGICASCWRKRFHVFEIFSVPFNSEKYAPICHLTIIFVGSLNRKTWTARKSVIDWRLKLYMAKNFSRDIFCVTHIAILDDPGNRWNGCKNGFDRSWKPELFGYCHSNCIFFFSLAFIHLFVLFGLFLASPNAVKVFAAVCMYHVRFDRFDSLANDMINKILSEDAGY